MIALIVDDSKLIRKVVRANLEDLEISHEDVYEANDGKEAIQLLAELKRVDLIITDLQMPNMDGVEFIKRIRKVPYFRKTRIIAVSSQLSDKMIETLGRLRVRDFIKKPFDLDKFMYNLKPIILEIQERNKDEDLLYEVRQEFLKALDNQDKLDVQLIDEVLHFKIPGVVFHMSIDNFLQHTLFEFTKIKHKDDE